MARPIPQIGTQGFMPTHGMTKTKIHKIWSGMIDRCRKDNKRYAKSYYNRGITVCERWAKFENFYEDMGDAPEGLSLDRIDVNGIYCKENCRWANNKTQQNNRQNTRYLNVNGEKVPLMNFAEKLGIKKSAAQYFYTVLKAINNKKIKISIWEN